MHVLNLKRETKGLSGKQLPRVEHPRHNTNTYQRIINICAI